MRSVALLSFVLVTGCGRIGFDALFDGTGGGDDGAGDAHMADAPMFTGAHSAYVKPLTPLTDGQFGAAMGLSADGSTLAVGAYGENNSAGACYVFTRANDVWTQQARLVPAIADAGDNLGVAVALSADGNTLACSAYRESSGNPADPADNTLPASGAAYVFVRSGTTWSQQAYLKAQNLDAGDEFGQGLALTGDGNLLAVSAHFEQSATGNPSDNSGTQVGAAYVFTRSGAIWTQTAYLKADNAGGDCFGESIDIAANGSAIAVGAYLESSVATNVNGDGTNDLLVNSGAVYVFEGPSWIQRDYVKAFNTGMSDQFGVTVGLAADGQLVVGAHLEASGSVTNQADDSMAQAGAVYTYLPPVSTLQPGSYLKAATPQAGAIFGLRVASSDPGTTIVAGAPNENGTGAAYVFTRVGTAWQQRVRLIASNADAGDLFGSVALSPDGTTLAIGAIQEDSNGDPADNSVTNAGAVYVYW
ncbi:MAG TPA: hypothetical protein VL326_06595 [Kofleriaceae bacterium]|nr:hypothetical protein [Kofleriaceae bacterium]